MRRIFWALVIALPMALAGWALTAKEAGNLGWGNVVDAKDQGAADLFGLPAPGAYVGTARGTALPAVRGGVKLILTFEDPALGARALKSHLFTSANGVALSAGLLLWIVGILFLARGGRARGRSTALS